MGVFQKGDTSLSLSLSETLDLHSELAATLLSHILSSPSKTSDLHSEFAATPMSHISSSLSETSDLHSKLAATLLSHISSYYQSHYLPTKNTSGICLTICMVIVVQCK